MYRYILTYITPILHSYYTFITCIFTNILLNIGVKSESSDDFGDVSGDVSGDDSATIIKPVM